MIQSRQDYEYYLERDRVSSGVPPMNSVKAKIKQLFFPHYEWQFIKALRWLEYCENVNKKHHGGMGSIYFIFRSLCVMRIELDGY